MENTTPCALAPDGLRPVRRACLSTLPPEIKCGIMDKLAEKDPALDRRAAEGDAVPGAVQPVEEHIGEGAPAGLRGADSGESEGSGGALRARGDFEEGLGMDGSDQPSYRHRPIHAMSLVSRDFAALVQPYLWEVCLLSTSLRILGPSYLLTSVSHGQTFDLDRNSASQLTYVLFNVIPRHGIHTRSLTISSNNRGHFNSASAHNLSWTSPSPTGMPLTNRRHRSHPARLR